MNRKHLVLIGFVFVFLLSSFFTPKDKIILPFKLKSATTNKWVSLTDYKKSKGFVVVFLSNKCPMAKLYTNRLNEINAKYSKFGVSLLAINAMDTLAYADESFKKMQKKVKNDKLNFPYLQDKNQIVVKQFGAKNTPQAFIIWKNKLDKFEIKYEGAIDDNAGEAEKAEHHYLISAVDELLKGKQITTPKSESFGCQIFIRGEKQKMN